jgi:hypothetical protein
MSTVTSIIIITANTKQSLVVSTQCHRHGTKMALITVKITILLPVVFKDLPSEANLPDVIGLDVVMACRHGDQLVRSTMQQWHRG